MDIFNVEVFLPSVGKENGSEPTIHSMVYRYYRQAFDDLTSLEYAKEYIEELSRVIEDRK